MVQNAAHSILSMARADEFDNSLVYGKWATWFKDNIPNFFAPSGIFARYYQSGVPRIRKIAI